MGSGAAGRPGFPVRASAGVLAAAALLAGGAICARRWLVVVTVHGQSMEPAYRDGDRLVARRTQRARRGDVVVLAPWGSLAPLSPWAGNTTPPGRWLIKRVVAMTGDPVPDCITAALPGLAGVRIPPGCFMVLGDNLAHSHDSRHEGAIRADRVRAVPFWRLSRSRPAGGAQPSRRCAPIDKSPQCGEPFFGASGSMTTVR